MNSLNLGSLLKLAGKKAWALILAFAIAAASAYCYCEFIAEKEYSAVSSVLVTNGAITNEKHASAGNGTVNSTDVAASLALVDTIIDILDTPEIFKKTAAGFGNKYTYTELGKMASIERRSETTLFVDICFTSNNPDEAGKLANLFAENACEYITEFIPNSNAMVAAKAVKASLMYPKKAAASAVSGLVAVLIVYIIFVLFESKNKTIKNEADFTSRYNIPVLGLIPDFENAKIQADYMRKGYAKYGKSGKK